MMRVLPPRPRRPTSARVGVRGNAYNHLQIRRPAAACGPGRQVMDARSSETGEELT